MKAYKGRIPSTGTLPLLACALLAWSATTPSVQAQESVQLQIRWIDTRPADGVFTPSFLFTFHDGAVDFYDYERPPGDHLIEFIESVREAVPLQQMWLSWGERYPDARFAALFSDPGGGGPQIGTPPPGWPRYQVADVGLDPSRHRFFSYLAAVLPSDDAFVGNEDPFEIELFDAEGRFTGPLYIDVFGSQVLDAGVCANREADLRLLDWLPPVPDDRAPCSDGEGLVLPHPGLNGSQRNPEGEPQNILGGEFDHPHFGPIRYDPVDADFSRPGYKLGRLMITRGDASRFAPTGSWYSPERSGEGFNVELVEPQQGGGPPRMLVYWYTYEPDGSGRQIWLTGLGHMEPQQGGLVRVDLHRTEGGRFASTDNPGLVERIPWGHLDLSFTSCSQGTVRYEPLDPDWPAGEYTIHRLSPAIEGLGWVCDPGRAHLQRPE